MTQISLTSADGFTFGAYKALPKGRAKGGVVVIQEIFGVNPHIRSVVDGYAEAGYAAIAPQIFDRVEPGIEFGYTDAKERDRGVDIAFNQLKLDKTLADIQAAIEALSSFGKVGVVGYCFGGLLAWLSACELSGLAAASCYYGGGIVNQLDRQVNCPVMMHFGSKDAHIPPSDVEAIRKAHPEVEIFIYDADHGFNCDERASYHGPSAKLALQRTLAHFDKYLDSL